MRGTSGRSPGRMGSTPRSSSPARILGRTTPAIPIATGPLAAAASGPAKAARSASPRVDSGGFTRTKRGGIPSGRA